MTRHLLMIGAALLSSATMAGAQTPPPQQDSQRATPFRVSVDVVAVDVQVIDKDGRPVPDLGPEKFTVTINGRKRRVVSAERIGGESGDIPAHKSGTLSGSVLGRIVVLAVDCVSFDATESRGVIQAAKDFVRQLSPDDFVGLSAYPNGAHIDPTTDHAAVIRALDTVVGQRDVAELGQFKIRPSEIVDMTREMNRGIVGPVVESVSRRECGEPVDPFCRERLVTDVSGTALFYEGLATASLGMLRSLVSVMGSFNGRKTMVLISGGLLASDSPGGRPDIGDIGIRVGKEAALANTAIYTIFVDASFSDRFAAQTRGNDKRLDNHLRDTTVLSGWLEQFSGAAGGALFKVQVGNAEAALERIRTEMGSYYLLGVEPADEDRDGRTHEISVKTSHPNVSIRGRRWVMVPRRGGGPTTAPALTAAAKPAPSPDPEAAGPPVSAAPPRRVVPPEIQSLADTFDRGNHDAMQRNLARTPELANLIRDFRLGDSPWPNHPKRTAVFALELAMAGLRSESVAAREEGGRLLGEYHARVRQPLGADDFECAWFLTEASGLEGLFLPESAMQFVPRALQRCPNSARLHLAHAFVSEQLWLRGGMTPAQEVEVVSRYEAAMKFPETDAEARVRAARFLFGIGRHERALGLLTPATRQSPDIEIRYFSDLVRGQILRGIGRYDEAATAFRSALTTWPGAQSARVALMTLLVNRGKQEEAAALAEAALVSADGDFDPWWTYWLGDFRAYSTYLEKLRELGR